MGAHLIQLDCVLIWGSQNLEYLYPEVSKVCYQVVECSVICEKVQGSIGNVLCATLVGCFVSLSTAIFFF